METGRGPLPSEVGAGSFQSWGFGTDAVSASWWGMTLAQSQEVLVPTPAAQLLTCQACGQNGYQTRACWSLLWMALGDRADHMARGSPSVFPPWRQAPASPASSLRKASWVSLA